MVVFTFVIGYLRVIFDMYLTLSLSQQTKRIMETLHIRKPVMMCVLAREVILIKLLPM